MGDLTQLKTFDTECNRLTGSLPESIGNWKNLTEFSVDYNQLTGSLPSSIGSWTPIRVFSVPHNRLNGTISSLSVSHWTAVDSAYLNGNDFTGQIPSSFCNGSTLTKLWADCDEVDCECCCSQCCTDGVTRACIVIFQGNR